MALRNKALDAITESDLQNLVAEPVLEDQYIDYKEVLPAKSELYTGKAEAKQRWLDEERAEFRRDVVALANGAGGDLIYGISEDRKTGRPKEVCGASVPNVDAEKRRITDMLQEGINPRIPGIALGAVTLANGKVVIIVRVPRSWAAPHMVTYLKEFRFYARTGAARHLMDVAQLRGAFVGAAQAVEQSRNFRLERLGRIAAGEIPLGLGARVVLHLVPLNAFDSVTQVDLASISPDQAAFRPSSQDLWTGRPSPPMPISPDQVALQPLMAPGDPRVGVDPEYWRAQFNFDGLLVRGGAGGVVSAYLQLFRNGIVEAVASSTLGRWTNEEDTKYIRTLSFENMLLTGLARFRALQQRLGVEPPIDVMLSLLGVAGYLLEGRNGLSNIGIDRQDLLIPDTLMESLDDDPAAVMRPLFDTVWNAAGYPRCLHYDETGKRQ